ncbi:PREDICTED: uncharacterized protein LOC109232405 [Nicotiana attenuata]|uniref:Myb/SANT-like DNA-binding domain-containing protein n=1 Tax=Nicotiana attenuata TaxID=49451 RepID=A0A1J6IUX1_NICAT|nr:PREDICTED: uncharacterized protein LOC109232405 [Nicotiana attenuata]OIS98928.1 hypothetical protein A4A49_20374 [Nicotiana attenuata]
MNSSGMSGGFLSGYNGGFLGMNRLQQPQLNSNNAAHGHQTNHNNVQSSMSTKLGLENDKPIGLMDVKSCMPFGKDKAVGPSNVVNNSNNHNNNTSDEDEPSFAEDGNGDNSGGALGKKGSPWQRMKWTDNVVRLLIQVVACVGDDGSLEGTEGLKRKSGCIQKKGKWKTVSRIMMSNGCHVSPQQCEDKFNDLNKRYKKLNDILGRGTSCAVVENPALMDSMPQLSAKAKDTVKKILNSKHLFYREMCAYHNGQKIPDCNDLEFPVHSSPVAAQCAKDNNGSQGDEAEENDESDDDDESDDEEDNHGVDERMRRVEENGNFLPRTSGNDNFVAEINEFFQDPTKSKWEQKMWIKKRMRQLEEEKIGIQAEALELEKRQFKWQRFCRKKDRELEIERLENEKLILENEHMSLQLKHKELEIDSKKPNISFNSAPLSIDRLRGRDQIDAARYH